MQRTGWGKSAVYFVATALLRAAGAGPTVIVSPLLALMRNQIDAAQRAGIRAATVNSANTADWERTYAAVEAGEVDLLLVSPERLNNPDFRDRVLPRLTATAGMLVVDEAHCISDWGHDFRPDYRRLRDLIAELPAGIPVLATTATANDRVVVDVTEQLGLGPAEAGRPRGGPLVLRGSLDRESLRLSVVSLPTAGPAAGLAGRAARRAARGGHRLHADHRRRRGGGRVPARARVPVASYTGRTEPAERLAAEADLLANRVKALVATSALGHGFRQAGPRVRRPPRRARLTGGLLPADRAGRAGRRTGRGGAAARTRGPATSGPTSPRWPSRPSRWCARRCGCSTTPGSEPLSTAAIETRVDLSRTRLEMLLKVLDADGAVRRVRGGWIGTGADWVYDEQRHRRIAEARRSEQQAMLDYLGTTGCRLAFLRRQLDDPVSGPDARCGRCDNCTGTAWNTVVDPGIRQAADERLARPGVEVAPRKQWPSGMDELGVPVSGRIKADELADAGRVIGRLSDIGWGTRLRELVGRCGP